MRTGELRKYDNNIFIWIDWMTGQETNLRRGQVQGGGGGARVL